jgi:hypothetical protein
MPLSRYVITSVVTVAAGIPATVTAGEPGSGGAAGYGSAPISAGYAVFPQSFQPGTVIYLDPAGPLYGYLNGAGALRPYVQGSDDVSHAAISNLVLSEGRNFRASEVQLHSDRPDVTAMESR